LKKYIEYEKNPDILNRFLEDLFNNAYSMNTVKGYESDLRQFFLFLIDYKNIKRDVTMLSALILHSIKKQDIYAFLVYLNYYRSNGSYTKQRKLAAIKSFYKWLNLNYPDISIDESIHNFENVEPSLRLPKCLTLKEAKKIQTVFNANNSKNYIRNNTIIVLLLSTGIRVSELTNINISNINFQNNSIRIKGKGNRYRIAYFSNYCKEKLIEYIIHRNSNEDALFLNNKGQRIGINGIEDICKKAYKLMGLEDHEYTVHTLRHTAATIMLQTTNDILLVKEFLGHQSILSTQIYTHVYKQTVKDAFNKNPLSNYEVK